MEKAPIISVIIPVYKTGKYLNECVASVKAQTFSDWEAILVDDGSPDDAPTICDELCASDSRISVIHKRNGGLSSARNAGIDRARGELVYFLDSDDSIKPYALQSALELMTDDKDAVIAFRYTNFYEDDGHTEERMHAPEDRLSSVPDEYVLKVIMGMGRAWRATSNLYRLSIIRSFGVRFPEDHVSEDIVFNLRYMSHARSIAFENRPALNVRKRSGSISNSFQPGFLSTIDFIDGCAMEYAENCGGDTRYADSLYMRNIVVYMMVLSAFRDKRREALDMISTERARKAAKNYCAYPYFESSIKRAYMRVMFVLLRLGLRRTGVLLAKTAARIIR